MEEDNSSPDYENGLNNSQYIDLDVSKERWIPECPGPSNRKHGKKREHLPEKELSKERSPSPNDAENTKDDKGKRKFQPQCREQHMPLHSATTSTYPSMMPQNTMNQWGASGSSSMPSMDMASTSTGMNPYLYVPTDPSMYGMMPQKVTKTFPSCTLVPPLQGDPALSRRNRPNGCKTVFVGGLPEKITKEIITEAFSDCGEISTVIMSKKNFCHIRFTNEHHVDQAMLFSGYRIKIGNKDEPTYSSRLHIDFAIAQDDQYEYDCLMMSREARYANDDFRPPSPPIVNYSESEAASVGENLRNEKTFKRACEVLITWLDRGECNKGNAGTFYSMIQSAYSHVMRSVAEETKIKEELTAVKKKLNQQSTSNAAQFTDAERVFQYALMQKVWKHLTKNQRIYIDQWKKQHKDIKMKNSDDLLEYIEDEMDMRVEEDRDAPEESLELNRGYEDLIRLQEEIDVLRNQLQTVNDDTAAMRYENEKKLEEEKLVLSGVVGDAQRDMRLVSLIAGFLNVHPLGAKIDEICSYLLKMDRSINTMEIQNLMKKHNTVFKEEFNGIGANFKKRWTFFAYKFCSSTTSESFF